MEQTVSSLLFPGQPVAERPLRKLLGLLSRPALGPTLATQFPGLIAQGPFPRLVALHPLEPLFRHHLLRMGHQFERVFVASPGMNVPDVSDFEPLARDYYVRRRIIRELFAALSRAGISRVVAVKGAALLNAYPSPALRAMVDIDLVLGCEAEVRLATEPLRSLGWRPGPAEVGAVWRHESGLLADLQLPATELSRRIFSRALPNASTGVHIPLPADHLTLVALHAARNGGARIWRDVTDAHALIAQSNDPVRLGEDAWALAQLSPTAIVSLGAFFRFINQWSPAAGALPETPRGGWPAASEKATAERLALYEIVSTNPAPPLALDLVSGLLRLPKRLGSLASFSPKGGSSQRDPSLGGAPHVGSLSRHTLKLRLLVALVLSGHFLAYRRIILRQMAARQAHDLFEVARSTQVPVPMTAIALAHQEPIFDPTFAPFVHRDLIVDDVEGHRILLHPEEARWALTNQTGVAIAKRLDGTITLEGLSKEISAGAGIAETTVLADLLAFVEQLREANMVANAALPMTPRVPRNNKPPSLTIYLTEQCNLRCKHCAVVEGKMPETTLTDAEIRDLIDQHCRNYSNPSILFLGGEPLLRRECMDLLEYAEQHSTEVAIATNGLLVSEEIAARFAILNHTRIQVSLDGADREVHDFIRGKGSFEKTWKAIELLCGHGLAERITIASVLTRSALQQIEELIERVAALGVARLRFLNLNKMRAAYTHWDAIAPDPAEMDKIYKHLIFHVRDRKFGAGGTMISASFPGFVPDAAPRGEHPCPLGKTLIVDSLGKLYNCPIMNTPEFEVGDIRKQSLSEMENGEVNQRLRREMEARRYAVPECVQCAWKNFCQGGCQAYSALRSGSVYVNDEFCDLRRDLYREHVLRAARIH